MARLGVNIDHVATVRQARRSATPDLMLAARTVLSAGADSIVMHLREDRRHIQDADVRLCERLLPGRLNLEMSVAHDIVRIACALRPYQATLVPERRKELTTEGGLDVASNLRRITRTADRLRAAGIGVSLFIDPQKRQIAAACAAGVDMIELHTGAYADASRARQTKALRALEQAARYGRSRGMRVFAGHGLTYDNVTPLVKTALFEEFNIGYSIVCRALFTGLDEAVRQMKALVG
jgi:pyridoxine 5-phosphate synthase